jgi:hypothetical protein
MDGSDDDVLAENVWHSILEAAERVYETVFISTLHLSQLASGDGRTVVTMNMSVRPSPI